MNNVIVGNNKNSRIFIGTKEMFKVIYGSGSGQVVPPVDPPVDPPVNPPVTTAAEVYYGSFITFGPGLNTEGESGFATSFAEVIWKRLTDGESSNGELVAYNLADWKALNEQTVTIGEPNYFVAIRNDLIAGKKIKDLVAIEVFDAATSTFDRMPSTHEDIKHTVDGSDIITIEGVQYQFVLYKNTALMEYPTDCRFSLLQSF